MTSIEKSLFDIFEQKGIFLSEAEKNCELEMDSLQFISIIVDIEKAFSITVDDYDLAFDKFNTFNRFLEHVEVLIAQNPDIDDTKTQKEMQDSDLLSDSKPI